MTEYKFANNAVSTLASLIGGGDVSLAVKSGEGSKFPSVSGGSGEGFYVLVEEGAVSEWMLCTDRAGDTLTVTRTDSNSFNEGATVKLALNAAVLEQFLQKGVYRTVTANPDGSLAALYAGEEVLNTNTNVWWKHCTGTTWKQMST